MEVDLRVAVLLLISALIILTYVPSVSSAEPDQPPTRICFTFPMPLQKKLGTYDLFLLPDTTLYLVPGAPMVPVKVVVYKVPRNVNITGVRVYPQYIQLSGKYRIIPSPQPRVLGPQGFNQSLYIEDPAIYNSSNPYPSSPVIYEVKRGIDPYTNQRVSYLVLRIFPIMYIPAEGTVMLLTNVTVELEYQLMSELTQPLQTIDLVVITSDTLETAAVTLAQWKNSTGFTAKVYTVTWIEANFAGSDTQEKIRNFISYMVNNHGTTWVIILGDVDQVPVRRAYIPGLGDYDYIETDLYYADLDGTWDTDGDGNYGEVEDVIDGYPDVYVGRLPASTLDEANTIIDKLMNYNPHNEWFRKALLLGTVTFNDALHPEGEILKDYYETNYLPSDFYWKKLYEGLNNLTASNVIDEINKCYGMVNFAGHGNVDLWYFGAGGYFLTSDVYSLTNGYNTSVIVAMSCLTADYGDTDVCIGEAFLLHSGGGAIAYFGASDTAYGYGGDWVIDGLAGEIDWRILKAFKDLEDAGETPTPGKMHVKAITEYLSAHGRSDTYDWYTVVEYGTLLGDPSLALVGIGNPPPPPPTPTLKGYVVDESGIPIIGSWVEIYDYDTGSLLYNITTTNGYYEIVDMSYGTYTIVAKAPTYTESSEDFYYPRVVLEKNLTLTGGYQIPPNTVLVVVDDDGNGRVDEGVWPGEIKSVVEAMGFNVTLWNESQSGAPPLDVLLHPNVKAVIWHAGTYYDWAVSPGDADTLTQFLNNGGRLLLEGENIAQDHVDDDFMKEVAHSSLLLDNVYANNVTAWLKHPVIEGLDNLYFDVWPPSPDGVEAVNNGSAIAGYNGTEYAAIVVYDGLYWGGKGRVVFLTFPLHYLSLSNRSKLIENSVRWLTTSYYIKATTNATTYLYGWTIKIVASVVNGSDPVTGLNVYDRMYYPNGSLVFESQMMDDGTGGDDVANDGNYTALYTVPEGMPIGYYFVEVYTYISGYTTIYDQRRIKILSPNMSPKFTIDVVDLEVIEGVIHMYLSVTNNATLDIEKVQYRVDSGTIVNVSKPVDGAYDSPEETVEIVIDAYTYALGKHNITVRCLAELGYESDWVTYHFVVRQLEARYNLIALSLEPLLPVYASDIAEAVGPDLLGIWRWDVGAQEFTGYVPGVSSPEEDFQLEMGQGYFVYMSSPAILVEVGW